MASEELVTEQFDSLGIKVENEVLSKCVSLCDEHGVDAETFTEIWMAFSLNHLNGAAPTLENLDLLVRKELCKQASAASGRQSAPSARPVDGARVTVYGTAHTASSKSENEEALSNYITGTPKRIKVENDSAAITQNELCPATYSPTVAHSAKYASRTNQGTVVHSYGDEDLLRLIAKPNGLTDALELTITQVPNDDGDVYTKMFNGFELLHEKASTFDNHIRYISQCIMKKAGIKEVSSVRHKTQVNVWENAHLARPVVMEPEEHGWILQQNEYILILMTLEAVPKTEVFVAGRVECDADARLNPQSVVLQGTWADSLSQAVSIDIDNLKQYSLLPGQVAVFRGLNPRGDKFVAHEVYHDASQPVPDHNTDLINAFRGTMSMVVTSGPYTTSDNLAYEPLKDIVSYIATNKPHVVIMTGPFLDCEHAKVKDNSMAETFRNFFDKLLDSLGELNTTCPYTKIYLVSSLRDAFHVNIYPTPPYSSRRKHPNIHFLPDPSTINLGGIVIGVTSTDVLMHLGQEEISSGMSGDKLSRLCGHVLAQQTYYPLWPTPASQPTDAALWAAHAQLNAAPHLAVLPSNFRYFIKEVNGCVMVNPEHVTKGAGGGTFARLLISADGTARRVAAQILRV